MASKGKRQGQTQPGGFKHEVKIKPVPAAGEEYCRQYFINLMLTGHVIVSPAGGAVLSKENLAQALESWG